MVHSTPCVCFNACKYCNSKLHSSLACLNTSILLCAACNLDSCNLSSVIKGLIVGGVSQSLQEMVSLWRLSAAVVAGWILKGFKQLISCCEALIDFRTKLAASVIAYVAPDASLYPCFKQNAGHTGSVFEYCCLAHSLGIVVRKQQRDDPDFMSLIDSIKSAQVLDSLLSLLKWFKRRY